MEPLPITVFNLQRLKITNYLKISHQNGENCCVCVITLVVIIFDSTAARTHN